MTGRGLLAAYESTEPGENLAGPGTHVRRVELPVRLGHDQAAGLVGALIHQDGQEVGWVESCAHPETGPLLALCLIVPLDQAGGVELHDDTLVLHATGPGPA